MHTISQKEVLTTGEVARICHVAPRTVSKWFDTGKLRGYRIPGSRDRRIPLDQLIAFMRTHGMPLDGLDGGVCRILIMDCSGWLAGSGLVKSLRHMDRYDVRVVENGFEAGICAQQFRPHAIVLDTSCGTGEAAAICRNIRSHLELQSAKVIAVTDDESAEAGGFSDGFDGRLPKPYSLEQLLRTVEEVTNLVS